MQANFDDAGADTLGHISQSVETFEIPNFRKLGIANLKPLKQVAPGKTATRILFCDE